MHNKSRKKNERTDKKYRNIVIEAIKNNDSKDAIQMLKDIQEDLKVIALVSEGLLKKNKNLSINDN